VARKKIKPAASVKKAKAKAKSKSKAKSPVRRATVEERPSPSVSHLKPLVTDVPGACQVLDCSRDQIYDLLHTSQIESYLDGTARRIVIASLEDYVARRRQSSTQFERGARYPVRDRKGADASA
jgi:excisionase family DNA binding protein